MKKALSALGTLSLIAVASAAAAQEAPAPPKVLQIIREQVKPGKAATHEKLEMGWPKAYAKANWPNGWIGMASVSGPPEAWFLFAWPSYAAMEKDRENIDKTPTLKAEDEQLSQQDGELLSGISSMLASYREDLSYRPNVYVAKMRYFSVTTWRVNQGRAQDFTTWRRMAKELHEKAKVDEHFAIYQVVSGAPAGTFLMFRPLKSMAEMDVDPHDKAYQDAVGEGGRARIRDLQHEALLSANAQIFAFNPKMSYVSKEFAAPDPDYWTPKPPPAKPAEPKK